MTENSGLRERKRQETLQRITGAGLKLFGIRGYEATTIDDIASEASISRRTFFHYFKSKDDILISLQSGMGAQLAAALRDAPAELTPLRAIREAGLRIVAAYPRDELVNIDRIMRSSEIVQARKRANYILEEEVLYEFLQHHWPQQGHTSLRVLAMLAIGAARLSLEAWSRNGNEGALADHINAAFDAIELLGKTAEPAAHSDM